MMSKYDESEPYSPGEDETLISVIEETMTAIDWLLSEEERRAFRRDLVDAMGSHPYVSELLDQLKPARVVSESDTFAKEETIIEPDAEREASGGSK